VVKNLGNKKGLANKTNNRAYIATSTEDAHARKSFGNFSNVHVDEFRKLNVVDLLTYKYVVITSPEESVKMLSAKA